MSVSRDEHPYEDERTERADALAEDAFEALRRHADERRRLSLVAYHQDGQESAPLDPGVPVIVGRRAPATLCVPSAKLSRAHARFTLANEGRVIVEDLGSTNGTWVGGQRVTRAEVSIADEVMVGDALVTVQMVPSIREVVPASRRRAEDGPIAVSAAARALFEMAARVASSSVPVVLQGETGTGKEVVARFLHERSPRAQKPLVSVNCAAIPAQLVESTLFGHERGAFTGAAQRQKGIFEEGDGGTVFLDEIGELPLPAQAALLRVLETGRFSRVGSAREVAVDVRIVAATHRDLEALSATGAFRADLYYRLSVMVLAIPALRERPEDIEPLARRFAAQAGGGRIRDIAPAALARIRAHAFPGNVRELRNTIERAAVLAPADVIREEDLPPRLREPPRTAPALPESTNDLRARIQDYEAKMIADALAASGWNQSEAARRLGMPIRTLSYKAKVLGLKKP
ncbi:Sigma-54 dependent response regulator [Minicystis rosea]|nr:Sigma-54 dependent response regulator [Minicystis rosea]